MSFAKVAFGFDFRWWKGNEGHALTKATWVIDIKNLVHYDNNNNKSLFNEDRI